MDQQRIKRYKNKLDIVTLRMQNINNWLGDQSLDKFTVDEKTKLAVYKAIQEVVESFLDMCAMVIKDSNLIPKDDYTNIETLQERKILSSELSLFLKEANGIRNALVHSYNHIDNGLVYNFVTKLRTNSNLASDWISKWLTKNK